MTDKELRKQIKSELKTAGYNAREISVSVKYAGYATPNTVEHTLSTK